MLSASALACSQLALNCSETSLGEWDSCETLLMVELCEGNIVLFLQASFAENKALSLWERPFKSWLCLLCFGVQKRRGSKLFVTLTVVGEM